MEHGAGRNWRRRAAFAIAVAVVGLGFSAGTAHAVPAPNTSFTVRQPDGTTFRARRFGDEWYHGRAVNGFTILKSPGRGYWVYAKRDAATGQLVPSRRRVGRDSPAGLTRYLRDSVQVAESDRSRSLGIVAARTDGTSARALPRVGQAKSLVILATFTNSSTTSSEPQSWATKFFGESNSVADYYREVSGSQFTFVPAQESSGTPNDGVVGWVATGTAHVGAEPTNWPPAIASAIQAADPFVDYAAYDTNRDGQITPDELHITVIAAGGEAATQCDQPAVWAHQWVMATPPTVDGIRPSTYTVFGEEQCTGGSRHPATIGVIAHELGHDLGWPDEYDSDGSSQNTSAGGVGVWSLMSYGAHNRAEGGFSGTSPAHPDAFLKAYQGWLTPTQVTGSRAVELDSAQNGETVAQLLGNPNGIDWLMHRASGTGEYFLLENRERSGYDRGLPGCGILIWKIDEASDFNTPNNNDLRHMVQLLGADGDDRYFDAGDAWSGSRAFDDDSTPSSGLYSGARSGVSARNFSSCAPRMTADVSDGTG